MIFNNIFRPFELKFKDRTSAAIALSELLKNTIKKNDRKDTLVLGIPRAGVLTANIICEKLSIPHLDIAISKKLTDPDNKEQGIGAVMENGYTFINRDLVKGFQISNEYLRKEIAFRSQQVIQRKEKYYQNLHYKSLNDKIKDYKIILLVDDGMATGATIMVIAKWILQFIKNSSTIRPRFIIATPIAPKNVTEELRKECRVEIKTVLHPPKANFCSLEQYHRTFEQVTDDQVLSILEKFAND